MYCERLEKENVIEIYTKTAKHHFPPAELKPVGRVCSFLEEGKYICYGLFEAGELLGYAFFLKPEKADFMLLDYYAIMEGHRNQKLGSVFLKLLKEEFKMGKEYPVSGFFIESEHPDFSKDEAERDLRQRRIAFYERNGAGLTEVTSRLFGVDYKILYVTVEDRGLETKEAFEKLEYIYHAMFAPKLFGREVKITSSLETGKGNV